MATQTLVRPPLPALPHPIRLPRPVRPYPVTAREQHSPSIRVAASAPVELAPRTTTYRASAPAVRAPRLAPVSRSAGVRITRRGRLALLMALTVLALVIGAVIQAAGRRRRRHPTARRGGAVTRTVTVQPGETLWQIARDIRPNADPRETVARIQELNGLTTATVWAGQPLIVPA